MRNILHDLDAVDWVSPSHDWWVRVLALAAHEGQTVAIAMVNGESLDAFEVRENPTLEDLAQAVQRRYGVIHN